MLNEADLIALAITFKLAGISTLILLLLGTPLAWWMANTRSYGSKAVPTYANTYSALIPGCREW